MNNTILIDSSIVDWIEKDWSARVAVASDGRTTRQFEFHYDNVALLWHYLTVAQPQDWATANDNAGDWVKVSQAALKGLGKSNKDFAELKEQLEALGFAQLDNRKKGIHYMAPLYSGELVPYELRKKKRDKLLASYEDDDIASKLLRSNMETSIDIGINEAREYLWNQYNKERQFNIEEGNEEGNIKEVIPSDRKELRQYNKVKANKTYTKEKYLSWVFTKEKKTINRNLNLLDAIKENAGSVTRDNAGGRLHSPFTQLRRELRQWITIDGEPIEEIDISHLHPTLIANEIINNGGNDNGLLNDCLQNEFYIKISPILEKESPLMPNLQLPPYFDGVRVSKRDRAKDAVMTWLNGEVATSRTRNPDRKAVALAMSAYYPDVLAYVDRRKRELLAEARAKATEEERRWLKAGSVFARYLQRCEARLFVDELFVAVSGRYKIPAFTIHDAIYIPASKRKRVRGLLGKVLADAGIRAADDKGEL